MSGFLHLEILQKRERSSVGIYQSVERTVPEYRIRMCILALSRLIINSARSKTLGSLKKPPYLGPMTGQAEISDDSLDLVEELMITLPKDIQEAVRSSEDQPVRLTDPETNSEYVLLP